MQDEQGKNIVDSQGNVFKSTKNNMIKQFFKTNIWNILGIGLPTCIILVGIVYRIISKSFAVSCASFYGIDKKYFSGTEMFEDKLIFIFSAFTLLLYPLIFAYLNKK
ncbi:MAG: hypothetical protein NC225_06875 [Clostridium sp.]|nr:hypothetical protein [Clostridium sp.]MCM1459214.1 hypothetical protein [Bacteroides sp.]